MLALHLFFFFKEKSFLRTLNEVIVVETHQQIFAVKKKEIHTEGDHIPLAI